MSQTKVQEAVPIGKVCFCYSYVSLVLAQAHLEAAATKMLVRLKDIGSLACNWV